MKFNDNSIRTTIYILSISSLAFASFSLRAEIFKWKDASGIIHYSDKAPLQVTAKPESSQLKALLAAQVMCSASEKPKNATSSKTFAASTKDEMASFFTELKNNTIASAGSTSLSTSGVKRTTVATKTTTTTTSPTTTTTSPTTTTASPTTTTASPTTTPTSNMNTGSMGMPVINLALAPLKAVGKNYIDLIPHQAGNVPIPHTGVEINNGEFRVSCAFSHMLNDDPIVKPNQPGASHLHTFFGNTGANAASTTSSLMSSGNSTCDGGTMNRSAYWVPTVIDTRTAKPIAPTGGNFYYKTENKPYVVQVPKGLRMIAGSMSASATQPFIHWWCADTGDNNVSGDQGYIPACAVGNHLIAVINFPAYWDGVNLDSADHKSHVSYSKDATHPVQLPDITYNIRYDIVSGDDTNKWRLSSDMYSTSTPGGYSLHADYMFGWSDDPVSGQNYAQIFAAKCLQAGMNCGNSLLGDGRQYYY